LRIRLFHDDHALTFDDLGLHFLLFVRFQIPGSLGFFAHALHGFHQIILLRQKRVAEIGGPLDVVGQTLDHIGQAGECLNAWVPRLLRSSIGECFVLQPGVLRKPLLELDDFERICGCGERLGQHRVGIESNGGHESIQLVGRNLCSLSLRRGLTLCRGCLLVQWHLRQGVSW
jgi:hypothetical protein